MNHFACRPRLYLIKAIVLFVPLLFALPAHAGGHYAGPVYTFTATVTDYAGNTFSLSPDEDETNNPNQYGYPISYNGGVEYSAQVRGINLNMTATFTWTPDADTPDAPPPDKSYFLETGDADAGDFFFCWSDDSGSDWKADNGLDDASSLDTDDESPFLIGYDCTSTGSHLTEKDGAVITFTHSLSSSLAGNYDAGSCGVFYSVAQVTDSLNGHSTADTAGWNAEHARFFSGTNCTASGSVGIDPAQIDHAQLLINDTVVNSYPDATNPNKSPFLNAVFDSTHFQDGDTITLKYKVWDKAGDPPVERTVAGPAYNQAYVLANKYVQYGDQQLAAATDAAQAANYTVNSNETDDKPFITETLPVDTLFFIDTHGNQEDFADCVYVESLDFVEGHQVTTNDITTAIAHKHISQPPYNFVMLDGCETAGITTGEISSGLSNAFGINGADRAFLGWHNEVMQSAANAAWVQRFWGNIAAGDSIQVAAVKSSIDGDAEGELTRGDSTTVGAVWPVILGDPSAKVHGVYGKDGLDWYKSL